VVRRHRGKPRGEPDHWRPRQRFPSLKHARTTGTACWTGTMFAITPPQPGQLPPPLLRISNQGVKVDSFPTKIRRRSGCRSRPETLVGEYPVRRLQHLLPTARIFRRTATATTEPRVRWTRLRRPRRPIAGRHCPDGPTGRATAARVPRQPDPGGPPILRFPSIFPSNYTQTPRAPPSSFRICRTTMHDAHPARDGDDWMFVAICPATPRGPKPNIQLSSS
jgi:hypothetical protein